MSKDRRAAKNFTNRLEGETGANDGFSAEIDEAGDAGVSHTTPTKASALRKGGFVMLRNNPCKIVEVSTSKPGKHGHAKVHLVGLDVLTGKKHEDISPSHHTMQVPSVKKVDFQVVDMASDGFLSLMDDSGNLRADIRVTDDELMKKIRDQLENNEDPTGSSEVILVSVQQLLGQEIVIGVKNGSL